jgi:hypothetical protein
MARRYGTKTKTARTWKKIALMNTQELEGFKAHLEKHNQLQSKVYSHVLARLEATT